MPGPTPSPYGGAPMGPAPRKSNGGLMAAIIGGVFVITLIGGIIVLFLYSAATSGSSSSERSSSPSPTSTYSPTPSNSPTPSRSPQPTSSPKPSSSSSSSSASSVSDEEENGVMEACRSALSQVVTSGRITDASIGKTGKNSKGEQQFEVKGQLSGTLAATGKNGTHNFTCSAVYHDSKKTYEASVTVDL
ncbi:hypothetical protein HMPREF1138_1834 [Actinomyces sp. ICM58]|nr:hypothetical protein HMPREF1138_1834 [Actinomyces sp. ICM58]